VTPSPTLEPTPTSTPKPASKSGPSGGAITLHVEPDRVGQWAVVQWQDGLGEWRAVEGWQGAIAGNEVMWWVSEEHYGTGPFRWAVYREQGGPLAGMSEPFDLPSSAYELKVTLADIPAKTAPEPQVYRVQPGDTLARIAIQFYGDESRWPVILEANADAIQDPNLIAVGQEILIP
jgi:LysM repeat protein